MHFSVVLCEFVLAREAIAFSVVLASDHRTDELGGVLAVPGGGVADEVRRTPRAEAAMLDKAAKGRFGVCEILPVMGPLMESTILCDNNYPPSRANFFGPEIIVIMIAAKPAATEMTGSVFMTFFVNDAYSKTHHAGTFLGRAYAR